jgi:hypothetical protein
MGNGAFTVEVRHWIGAPMGMAVQCQCGACSTTMAAHADHAVCCWQAGFVEQHSTIRWWVQDSARALGYDVSLEAAVGMGLGRPTDVLIHGWNALGGATAINVSMVYLQPASGLNCSDVE